MRYKHKNHRPLIRYFCCLFIIIILLFIIATTNSKKILVASNINTVKSIESSRIIKVDNLKEYENNIDFIQITNPENLNFYQNKFIQFNGTIKSYSLDNEKLSCETHSKITNKIYYKDNKYGNIRILAADNRIPCGTIIKVSIPNKNTIYGIVLDRQNESIDFNLQLLFENNTITKYLNKYDNINYKILRWSY